MNLASRERERPEESLSLRYLLRSLTLPARQPKETTVTFPFFTAPRPLSRRSFLRGAGVALSLPLLDAMVPAFARAKDAAPLAAPRRMVAIQTNLGILPHFFWPENIGTNYGVGNMDY